LNRALEELQALAKPPKLKPTKAKPAKSLDTVTTLGDDIPPFLDWRHEIGVA
jgi:hypothetical protein